MQWFISRFFMVWKKPLYKTAKKSLQNGFLETVSKETKKTREFFSPCSLGTTGIKIGSLHVKENKLYSRKWEVFAFYVCHNLSFQRPQNESMR